MGRRMPSGQGYRVISGGGKFIMPIVESYEFLDLEVWSLMFDLKDVRIDPGIPDGHSPRIAIEATALLKISSSNEGLMVAAEHLLRKTKEEIEHISRKIIEGHIRTTLRNLPAETIDNDRDMVASKIQVRAEQDLINVGLEVRAFTMNSVDLRG